MDHPIPLDRVGRIASGDEQGRYVRVVDDTEQSGGFLIFTSDDPKFEGEVFDNWVLDYRTVGAYFRAANWIVEWEPDR